MSHLSPEELARLVDEAPTAKEADHLERCAECHSEWMLLRRQTAELTALPPLSPPAHEWRMVEARLREEGLIRRPIGLDWRAGTLRAAAALTFFLIGGATGYAARGEGPGVADPSRAGPEGAMMASAPASLDDAAAAVLTAEADYLDALAAYNRVVAAQGQSPDDMVARLAALQSIVLTTRAALSEAPADPVINGYHFTALAQRDAVLQQIASVSEEPWF